MSTDHSPDFIIAGATRCGTTTLYEVLSRNPGIFMPSQKELHFFYRDADFGKGRAFYERYFSGAKGDQICGEASPTYFTKGCVVGDDGVQLYRDDMDSAQRLHAMFPDMKIVFSLRHPARRAHSLFWRFVWRGHESVDCFEEAIEEELAGARTPQNTPLCSLYYSHYKTHLEHWFSLFPRENIHIMIMEEWTRTPAAALAELEAFIGAPASGLQDSDVQQSNQGRSATHPLLAPLTRIAPYSKIMRKISRHFLTKQGHDKLSEETYARLCDVFADDIAYLEEVLGRGIDVWR